MADRTGSGSEHDGGKLRYVAGGLAIVVAMIHLLHPRLGAPRLLVHIQQGILFDPRPLVFTISGFLMIVGILLVYQGVFVRQVYVAGVLLMLSFLFGYAAWHTVLDHGAFWPHIHGHGHDTGVVETIRIHLVDDTVALVSKLLEAILLAALVVLYRMDTDSSR